MAARRDGTWLAGLTTALVKHRTPFAPIGLTDTISGRVDFLLQTSYIENKSTGNNYRLNICIHRVCQKGNIHRHSSVSLCYRHHYKSCPPKFE